MKYVLVYWSRFGNGKRVVETLSVKLGKKGSEVKILDAKEFQGKVLPEADLYVFSAPAEKFTIPKDMRRLMKGLQGMEGKRYGLINTHSMKRDWLPKMDKFLSGKKMVKLAEVEFRMGDGTEDGKGLREGWKQKLDDFADKLTGG